jgi:rhamnogalacturonan endolyase
MEALTRGVVAVKVDGGVYVGWRMFGYEYDPQHPTTSRTTSTAMAAASLRLPTARTISTRTGRCQLGLCRARCRGGRGGATSGDTTVWADNYLRIPLDISPRRGHPGFAHLRDPERGLHLRRQRRQRRRSGRRRRVRDRAQVGSPSERQGQRPIGLHGQCLSRCLQANGTRLWRIDLGVNIRAGAHYTQFLVYDFDGDGKAEVALKTAPGTKDGTGAYLHTGPAGSDDDSADYRSVANASGTTGYVLTGPEYLTVFEGRDRGRIGHREFRSSARRRVVVGRRLRQSRGSLPGLGRVRQRFGAGKSASGRPSLLIGSWLRQSHDDDGVELAGRAAGGRSGRWTARRASDAATLAGQGAHSMAMADVDNDGAQEIIFGAATINSDGTPRCSTNLGARRRPPRRRPGAVAARAGGVHAPRASASPIFDVRDADTCEVIAKAGPVLTSNTTRGVADDVSPAYDGAEAWTNNSGGVASATTGDVVDSTATPSLNFLIYWDADESRELEDGTAITKYGGDTCKVARPAPRTTAARPRRFSPRICSATGARRSFGARPATRPCASTPPPI